MQDRMRGHELHAPALLRFEIANVCLKKIRLNPNERSVLIKQHKQSMRIALHQHIARQVDVLSLAERFNLSAYDASYLWLSRKLGCELVTLDKKLQKAADKL